MLYQKQKQTKNTRPGTRIVSKVKSLYSKKGLHIKKNTNAAQAGLRQGVRQ